MNVDNGKYIRSHTLNNDNLSGYLVVNIIISKGTMVQNYNEEGARLGGKLKYQPQQFFKKMLYV